MDRAQRRQRRLDQKMWRTQRGRGRPKRQVQEASNRESVDHPGGPKNASEGESTDDVICEGGAGDLQVKLHVCEAEKLKWRKISEERWEKLQLETERRKFAEEKIEKLEEKNKEKDTEIECLNLKIKQIAEDKSLKQGQSIGQSLAPESLYLKLRGENQVLEEKTKAYRGIIDRLFKGFSSEMDTLSALDGKSKQVNTHHQAGKIAANVGRNVFESASEAHVDQLNDHHPGKMQNENLGRNGYGNAPRMDVNGYHQLSKKTAAPGKTGHNSAGELDIDVGGQRIGHHHHMGCEEVHHVIDEIDPSEEDVIVKPYVMPEQPEIYGNVQSLDTPVEKICGNLLSGATKKAALDLVDQEFLIWLNCRVRRPTTREMAFHKSHQYRSGRPCSVRESFYWTGITESSLLEKFTEENGKKRPTSSALTTLLRTVLQIDGTHRINDMVWCLVWVDCISPDQLPGYVSYPEFSPRSVKIRTS